MANYCSNCGTKLKPDQAYCHECGAKVVQTNTDTPLVESYQARPVQVRVDNHSGEYNNDKPMQDHQQVKKPKQRQNRQSKQAAKKQRPQQQKNQQLQQSQRPNGRKHSTSLGILTVFLTFILVVESVVAGLWYPGFFNRGTGGNNSGTTGFSGETGIVSENFTDDDYNIDYSEQEISAAPKTEMKISAGNPSASAGDFAVDFGAFNEMEDDTFTVRELPVHDFGKDCYSVKGYDLSLASGKHTFTGEVCVTYPRTGEEGDLVQFMSKNPDTGENERLYYEISDDGKNYLVYSDHFSQQVMLTKSGFGEKLKQDIQNRDVTDPLTRDALSAFFYNVDIQDNDYSDFMNCKVDYCPAELWKKVNNSTNLPSARYMLEAMVKEWDGSKVNWDLRNKSMSGLLLYDEKSLKKNFDDLGAVLNGKSAIEDGIKVIKGYDNLSTEEIIKGIKAGGKWKGFDTLCGIATMAGFYFNTQLAIKEVEDGKYDDMEAATWGHMTDNLGTAVSVVGLAAAIVEFVPVTLIAALGGLGLYFYSKSTETPYDDLTQTELNYRMFFREHSLLTEVAYDTNWRETQDLKVRRLTCLDDKHNDQLNRELKFVSCIPDEPRSLVKPSSTWLDVLKKLYYVTKDQPELLNTAVLEFYKNYAEAYSPYLKDEKGNRISTISESEYLSFSREVMEARGAARSAARLPDEKEMNEYTERMFKEMLVYHRPIFLEFAKFLSHQAELEADEMIERELVPLLNTRMIFNVEDTALEEGKTFESSIYNRKPMYQGERNDEYLYMGKYRDMRQNYIPPMEFYIHDGSDYSPVQPPKFFPGYGKFVRNLSKYQALFLDPVSPQNYFPVTDNFWPKWMGGNTVFKCTYYHYLMMGAPNTMSFYDMDEDERFSDDFEIPEPDEKGNIVINIKIDGKKPEEEKKMRDTEAQMYLRNDNTLGRYASFFDMDFNLKQGVSEVAVNDKDVAISLSKLEYQTTKEMDGSTVTTTYKRDSIQLAGVIDRESENGMVKYGHITKVDPFKGSCEQKKVPNGQAREYYVDSEELVLENPLYDKSYFDISYNSEGKIERMTISIEGGWKLTTSWKAVPIVEGGLKDERTQTGGYNGSRDIMFLREDFSMYG